MIQILKNYEVSEFLRYGRLLSEEERIEKMIEKVAKPLYTQREVLVLLGVSPNTLKKYRENGYISYSRVDDKYFYSPTDISDFLKNNHHIAFHFEN